MKHAEAKQVRNYISKVRAHGISTTGPALGIAQFKVALFNFFNGGPGGNNLVRKRASK